MQSTLEGAETAPTQGKPTIRCSDSWLMLRTDRSLENVHASWVCGGQVISQDVFSPYYRDDFTIVPLFFLCLCKQCLLLLLLQPLSFCRWVSWGGVIFIEEWKPSIQAVPHLDATSLTGSEYPWIQGVFSSKKKSYQLGELMYTLDSRKCSLLISSFG